MRSKDEKVDKRVSEFIKKAYRPIIADVKGYIRHLDMALAFLHAQLRVADSSERDSLARKVQALEAEKAARIEQLKQLKEQLANAAATLTALAKSPKAEKKDR